MISGYLKRKHKKSYVCCETIYRFIYESVFARKAKLWQYLRRRHKKRTPFGFRKKRRALIPHLVSIHKRSSKANRRLELGHWEGDLIMNKGGNVLVIIERKSRYMMAFKNPSKHAHIILNKLKILTKKICRLL